MMVQYSVVQLKRAVQLKKIHRSLLATILFLILGLTGAVKANAESDNADLNLVLTETFV